MRLGQLMPARQVILVSEALLMNAALDLVRGGANFEN
jgi:hypothetical protein